MQILPSELKHLIAAELSRYNDLAALALTHSAYRREAERVLYENISIYFATDKSLKCMETLAIYSEKAALVRSLIVEYAPLYVRDTIELDNIVKNLKATIYLSKSLINMHSLSDFRLILNHNEVERQIINLSGLGDILWSVCRIFIFSKLMAIQSTSFSITNFLLSRRS